MLKKAKLYFNTIKYLEPRQIYWQIRYRLYRSKPKKFLAPACCREISSNDILWLDKSSYIDESTVKLININQEYKLPNLWLDCSGDDLWGYNIHYFDYLNNPKVDNKLKKKLVTNWIDKVEYSSAGWQAYPTSLRIVNWVKWIIENNITDKKIIQSLYSQCCYLDKNIEHHILANHLFANIKALVIAGIFFDSSKSNWWFKKYSKLCLKEIKVQILKNGGHYELSPMYHNIVLEDILDLICFYKIFSKRVPEKLCGIVEPMLEWSKAMAHPDGEVSFFNDSVTGIASSYVNLANYAKCLGIEFEYNNSPIKDCDGYFVVRKGAWDIKFDASEVKATHQPGHTHADALSFELSVLGKRFFVNSGISTYHDLGIRQKQRSTSTHNTMIIDVKNSSNVWSKFRLAQRANITQRSAVVRDDDIVLEASHDGYKFIKKSLLSSRKITATKHNITIEDSAIGGDKHSVQLFFFLHPDVIVSREDNRLILQSGNEKLKLCFSSSYQIKDSTYFPGFNCSQRNKVIVVSDEINRSYSHTLTIESLV